MKLLEISNRIQKHLTRFERDPIINPLNPVYKTRHYHMARSWKGGSRVFVKYVSYQMTYSLTKEQAIKYLEWLDAGNIGDHHKADINAQAQSGW